MDLETWLAIIVALQTLTLIVGILRLGLMVEQRHRRQQYRVDLDRLLGSVPNETMGVED